MIEPTPGRVVWVRRNGENDTRQAEAGIIIAVHHSRLINVVGWDHNGHPFVLRSCYLHQGDTEVPADSKHCWAEWMPYQKGQAAKTEALERQVGAGG